MLGNSRIATFFQWLVGRKGRNRLAKAASAESCGQRRNEKLHAAVARSTFKPKFAKHTSFGPLFEAGLCKNCTPLWREAHFQVKMDKTPQVRTIFWSWDVEELQTAAARSTFASQNVHFRTTDGEKCTRLLARSTFSSQNAQNTPGSDHFLKLGRGKIACHSVKTHKTPQVGTTFWRWDVEKLYPAVARSTFSSQNAQNTLASDHFFAMMNSQIIN